MGHIVKLRSCILTHLNHNKLYCSGKMFTSDNQTLRSLSWLIRNRFIAVSKVYGILSSLQSVDSSQSYFRFRFYCLTLLQNYCAFIFCTFNCSVNLNVFNVCYPCGVIINE